MRRLLLTLIGTLALALMSFAPASMAAGSGSGGGGSSGGGGEETTEVSNNLSVPAEFVPSSTTQGAPVLNVPCSASPQAPQGPMAGGYWEAAADGGVFTFGNAMFYGSMGGTKLTQPIVGIAAAKGGNGYWLVARDGGIFAFGTAKYYGSTGAVALAKPIVGMAPTPDGRGYWLVASDGGIFTFGDAHFYGSTGNVKLAAPIVGMAVNQVTGGYWLVASDGGVFAFNAPFYGSMGAVKLAQPIKGMTGTPTGKGYRMVASDGGIFAFGDAGFYGSTGGIVLNQPIVGMADTYSGHGYEMVASDGGVFNYGDAVFYGSMGGTKLAQPVVGIAHYPGYWLQGTTATWSAYCADVATASATAQWGSNLKDSTALHADSPIRVEVALLDMAANGSPYQGYAVTNLTPNVDDRYATYGTNGNTFLSDGANLANQTRIWTPGTTLNITGETSAGEPYNLDTAMAAEINSSGAVVYGFNWGGGSTGTTTPAGTYTLTFSISSGVVGITGVVPGSAVMPVVGKDGVSTSITVTVK